MKPSLILYWLFVLVCIGCTQKRENQGPRYGNAPIYTDVPVYSFAVHPLHNPEKLIQNYQPLLDYLNANVKGARFTLETSRDYASFEKKYLRQKPDLLLPNPWQTLQAMKAGYHVIAMAGEPTDFKGIFIIRKNSGIRNPSDLKGKTVSYPAPTALAACIMPQYFLHCAGIDVSSDIVNKYVGSQESAIMNVFLGQTAAGATWPPPWRAFQKEHPRESSELRVIWETESLINNSVMIRNNLPIDLQRQVQKLLIGLQETKSGREILRGMETARFLTASDKDYEVVRTYVNRFEKEVRKIETK